MPLPILLAADLADDLLFYSDSQDVDRLVRENAPHELDDAGRHSYSSVFARIDEDGAVLELYGSPSIAPATHSRVWDLLPDGPR